MTPDDFRAFFPALDEWVWLDTPGSPPGAAPVVDVMRRALDAWLTGSYDWATWDRAVDVARSDFARYTGLATVAISSQGSLAEASTIAVNSMSSTNGTIVVAEDEFRSVLYPALRYGALRRAGVDVVARRPGISRTAALLEAIGPTTGLVMVSEVLTNDGELVDIYSICQAAHDYGALVYANLTQTLGVLRIDLSQCPADIIAAHGYKWMLCPRGAAWLAADPAAIQLRPTVVSWKSASDPRRFFGGPYTESDSMARCNTSPAWMSWIGATAALRLLMRIDQDECRAHTLRLAAGFANHMRELGFRSLNNGEPSHVVVTAAPGDRTIDLATLRRAGVRAAVTESGAFRVGFHYFNTDEDVDRAVNAVKAAIVR